MSCCCSSVGDAVERQFSQRKAAKELGRYRAKGPEPTTRLLLAGLTKAGLLHGRLLDVGSGIGALTFEMLERGVTSAVGVDLSSAHVETASKEASRRNLSDCTRFVQGDFVDVASQLPSVDIVALDRVVCCYPEYEGLLDESLRHANLYFAFSYPRDLWYVRAWVGLENGWRRITRNTFRAFVHPVSAMENVIHRSGFKRLSRGRTRTWSADVYARS
jgi:SAM-dependent methyltransferase